jgi:hydroxyacylglutathione hydrolase
VTVEPGNSELEARLVAVSAERRAQNATIPTTMALELATNPFLRPDRAAIRAVLNLAQSADDAQVIGALRKHKDAVGGVVAWLVMSLYPVADYFNMA